MPGARKGQEKKRLVSGGSGSGEAAGSSVQTTSTLPFTVDGTHCHVDGLGQEVGTEYDCRSQLGLDEIDGVRGPSYTTNAFVDAGGGLSWVVASTPDTRPGTYHTKLCAPGTTEALTGPDGNLLDWKFPNPDAA